MHAESCSACPRRRPQSCCRSGPRRTWLGTGKTVPAGVIRELAQLEQAQDDLIRELEDIGKETGVIMVYRGDGVVPDRPELPARWHRVAAATALRDLAEEGIDVRIIYADE
ncbi:hypothetical protein GS538_08135 [Rhodococcus hoagii]|nr:hypothetical protein [Prescottella equi]